MRRSARVGTRPREFGVCFCWACEERETIGREREREREREGRCRAREHELVWPRNAKRGARIIRMYILCSLSCSWTLFFSPPFFLSFLRFWFGMRILPASWVSPPWLNDGCFSIPALFLFLFFSFLRGFLCVEVNEESQRNKLNFVSSLLCVWRLSSVLVVIQSCE